MANPSPTVRRRPRTARRAAALAVGSACLAAALVGCGSDGSDAAEDPTTTVAVPADAATDEGTPDDAAASDEAAIAGTPTEAASDEAHEVTHAMGTTEVPGDPQRVVVLDSSLLDSAIAVGLVPIGAVEGLTGSGLPAYLGDVADVDVDAIEIVGSATEPNLEQIASLRPDVIIGTKVRQEAVYEQLSGIAPTVFSESSGTNWQEQVRITGEALSRADRADELLTAFDARAAEVGDAVGAEGRTAVIVRFVPGQIRLYGPETFSGSVLTAVGFDLTGQTYDPAYGMGLISPEQVELLDVDVIFATDPETESGGTVESDRATVAGLWDDLTAVRDGNQFDVLDSTWMTGIGVIGAGRILDDLETFLG